MFLFSHSRESCLTGCHHTAPKAGLAKFPLLSASILSFSAKSSKFRSASNIRCSRVSTVRYPDRREPVNRSTHNSNQPPNAVRDKRFLAHFVDPSLNPLDRKSGQ